MAIGGPLLETRCLVQIVSRRPTRDLAGFAGRATGAGVVGTAGARTCDGWPSQLPDLCETILAGCPGPVEVTCIKRLQIALPLLVATKL